MVKTLTVQNDTHWKLSPIHPAFHPMSSKTRYHPHFICLWGKFSKGWDHVGNLYKKERGATCSGLQREVSTRPCRPAPPWPLPSSEYMEAGKRSTCCLLRMHLLGVALDKEVTWEGIIFRLNLSYQGRETKAKEAKRQTKIKFCGLEISPSILT